MKESVKSAVTPQEVRNMTQELCDIAGNGLNSGIHPGPKADEAANYILSKLREFGLNTNLEPVIIRDPWPESWSLTVHDKGKSRDIYCIPYGWTIGTPKQGIEAKLVYVHEGTARWFQEVDVKGKIVLVDHKTVLDFITAVDVGRTDCIENALAHGAIGIILAERTNPAPQFRCITMGKGHLGDPDVIAGLPVFDCGRVEGDYLRSLCQHDATVTVKMKLDVPHAYKECHNVVGILPGNGSIDEILITYCHYDGCFTSALDNNAGIAFVLGLAKYFAAIPQKSRNRNMWFTFLFGHDTGGNQGHRQFVAAHKDIMPKLIAFDIDHPVPGIRFDYVNGEMIPTGEDNLRIFGGTNFTLAEMARWVNYKHGLRSAIIMDLPWGNPNSRDFMAEGVPVAVTGMSFAWYYHTPEDKMEYIPLEQFERSFPADCEMLEMMSHTPEGYLIFNDTNLKRAVPNTPPRISLQVLSSKVLAGDRVLAWIGQDISDDRPLIARTIFPKYAGIVWDWGDGTKKEEELFGIHVYKQPGTFTLTITITDYQGAKTSATHTFVVLAKPER